MKAIKVGFTLVEMIVVITVLAILATIGLVSYASYLPKMRDTARLGAMNEMITGMEAYRLKGKLPIPDDSVEIKAGSGVIAYQGVLGKNVLKSIRYDKDGRDPEHEKYYDYYLSKNGKHYQFITYFEKQNIEDSLEEITLTSRVHAEDEVDYAAFFIRVFGNDMGILTSTGMTPINRIESIRTQGSLDLLSATDEYVAHLNNKDSLTGNSSLAGTLKTLAVSQNFGAPKECMKGFIPVPGNRELHQPGFCVAKYEMTYANGDGTTDDSYWNVYEHSDSSNAGKYVASKHDFPVTHLTIAEAIDECKRIGTHLITSSEWQTIARNIEQEDINWSGGAVNQGNVYNGNSNNSTYGTHITEGGGSRVARTGGKDNPNMSFNRTGNERRQHMLSNEEIIWDFAGNVEEFVNKTNDVDDLDGLDGQKYDMVSDGSWIVWDHSKLNNQKFRELYGPTISLTSLNSLGRIYEETNTSSEYIFIRGGYANSTTSGIFTLNRTRTSGYSHRQIGFRCAH